MTINGIRIIPLVTLVAALVVGMVSNGYSKEELEKIKALFSKSNSDEIVLAEIKKTLKENEVRVKEFNKVLATKQAELDNLNGELEGAKNTCEAKKSMYNMTPRLATMEDVQLACNAVAEVETKIHNKKVEIEEVNTTLENLSATISALKSKL